MNELIVSGLVIYPVKSLKGIKVKEAVLLETGLKYDRMWMIVDEENNFVTQRKFPVMAKIEVRLTSENLIFKYDKNLEFSLPLDSKNETLVKTDVWQNACQGYDEGNKASDYFTSILTTSEGQKFRLIKFDKEKERKVTSSYLKDKTATTYFADGFPYLITNENSLSLLNESLSDKNELNVDMNRFRANIIVKNMPPFEEHKIRTAGNFNYSFEFIKPCKRCKIVTINQETSEIPNHSEPLKTLIEINKIEDLKSPYFGVNSILLNGKNQKIRVGDKLIFKKSSGEN